MKVLDNLKYTKDHEWIKYDDGKKGIVGITDFAQSELGDVVFVELPNIGDTFNENDVFGTIEAVKTVADLYIPVSGKVVAINEDLESEPELINSSPYDRGWIVEIELSNHLDLDNLLSDQEYKELIK